MSSRRLAKVAEALREIVSTVVLFELKDPRVKNVTVLRAEAAPDLRTAKIYVSVMGDEKTRALSMHGLNAARGFIQSKIADRLQTRYTPVLQFVSDPGIRVSVETSAVIRDALANSPPQFAEELPGAEVGAGSGTEASAEGAAGVETGSARSGAGGPGLGEGALGEGAAAEEELNTHTTQRDFDEEDA